MTDVLAAAAAAVGALCPNAPPVLVDAITLAAEERPILADDGRRTAVLLAVTAFAESSCRADALGDRGRSAGFFGLWCGTPARCAIVVADPFGSARIARDMLATSLTVCRARPPAERLGLYLGSTCAAGLPQSRYRWWLFSRLARREAAS